MGTETPRLSNPTHPHVKWNLGAQTYETSFVYDVTTGEQKTCYPVDVKELVASGAYSYGPPDLSSAEEATAGEGAHPEKRGPGRPRKEES